MAMKIKVPSIVCEGCAETISREIKTHEPNAKVDVSIPEKMVTVETEASEASIRQMITATGHTIEEQ